VPGCHRIRSSGRNAYEELRQLRTSGQVQVTGESWHLRAENGRLVLSGAGLIAIDLITGDILRQTPGAQADAAAIICPALGGAPAT